jgi:hypothetical protein
MRERREGRVDAILHLGMGAIRAVPLSLRDRVKAVADALGVVDKRAVVTTQQVSALVAYFTLFAVGVRFLEISQTSSSCLRDRGTILVSFEDSSFVSRFQRQRQLKCLRDFY